MNYLRQFTIIALITLVGEAMSFLIPLPIPASIFGIAIMLALLISGRLKVESVKDVSSFLLTIMPVMFIPAVVGLMESFSVLKGSLAAYIIILVVSTFAIMGVSGVVTQRIIDHQKNREDAPHA